MPPAGGVSATLSVVNRSASARITLVSIMFGNPFLIAPIYSLPGLRVDV